MELLLYNTTFVFALICMVMVHASQDIQYAQSDQVRAMDSSKGTKGRAISTTLR